MNGIIEIESWDNLLLIFIILFVVFYKFASNYISYIKLDKFSKDYQICLDILDDLNENEVDESLFSSVRRRTKVIENLVVEAGVKIPRTYIYPMDFMTGITTAKNINVFDYLLHSYEDVRIAAFDSIEYACGVFRQRALDSLNPLYWIKSFLFLPQNMLSYLNFETRPFLNKLLNIIWWAINLYLSLYSDFVRETLNNLLGSFLG